MNLYCIKFPNGKRYVGVESIGSARWSHHCNPPRNGRKTCVANAIAKYGKENCVFKYLVQDKNSEMVLEWERDLIRAWKLQDKRFGYNISDGGCGASGIKHSDGTKELLSKKSKSLWLNSEYRSKTIAAHIGKVIPRKTRLAVSKANKGVPKSPEHIEKVRLANLGLKRSTEMRDRMAEKMNNLYKLNPQAKLNRVAACHSPEIKLKATLARKVFYERRKQLKPS
jgi:group I intron endonuclease